MRTAHFLSVTDNWNNALKCSSGDYVVMLGDDDCLLKGYFRELSMLIDRFSEPDCIYVDALQFAYPGVVPGHAKGFVQLGYSKLFEGRREPILLPRTEALAALMSLAFCFALAREWRGTLVVPIIMHGVNNGLVLGLVSLLATA